MCDSGTSGTFEIISKLTRPYQRYELHHGYPDPGGDRCYFTGSFFDPLSFHLEGLTNLKFELLSISNFVTQRIKSNNG